MNESTYHNIVLHVLQQAYGLDLDDACPAIPWINACRIADQVKALVESEISNILAQSTA